MSKDFLGVEYAPFCSLLSAKFPTIQQALLHALEKLQEEGPDDVSGGICHNVLYADDRYLYRMITHYSNCPFNYHTVMEVLYEIFAKWPHYTGMAKFPVPHPKYPPGEAFVLEKNVWIGEYGEARRRLLDFIISTLQEATA